jgi:hypothetical protein
LHRATTRIAGLDDRLLGRSLTLRAQVGEGRQAVRVPTSIGRELAFVISHTIHHGALIAVLLERAGLEAPPRLGMAPTTPDNPELSRSAPRPPAASFRFATRHSPRDVTCAR